MKLLLLLSTLTIASEQCYETLKNVEHYTLKAIETNSSAHYDAAKFYCDKSQIDCVVYAESMDATRHLKNTIGRIDR